MEFSPYKILKDSIKAVPAMKYALGIAGLVSVIAIVAGFNIDYRLAVFGIIIIIGLMFLLLLFSNAASSANRKRLLLPAIVLTWSFMLLMISATLLLGSSFFFSWPKDISFYFPQTIESKNMIIEGTVVNSNNEPVIDAEVTVDAYNFYARTNESGKFMEILKNAPKGSVIKIRVYHPDYRSWSINKLIENPEDKFLLNVQLDFR